MVGYNPDDYCGWCRAGLKKVTFACKTCKLPLCRNCAKHSKKGVFLCEACYRDIHGHDCNEIKIEVKSFDNAVTKIRETVKALNTSFSTLGAIAGRVLS